MTGVRPAIETVPVGLRVGGRLVVVVGAGRIAARKAAAYLDQGADLRIVAPDHGPEMQALEPAVAVAAHAGAAASAVEADSEDLRVVDRIGSTMRIERLVCPYRPSHLDGAWLVVAATGRPEVDGAVFAEAERRRLWCNAADDPDHCSVVLPAVVRRGPITVGISTGGTSPATASWLRRRTTAFIERELLSEPAMAAHQVTAQVRTDLRSVGRPTEIPGWQEALAEFEDRLRRLLDAPVSSTGPTAGDHPTVGPPALGPAPGPAPGPALGPAPETAPGPALGPAPETANGDVDP